MSAALESVKRDDERHDEVLDDGAVDAAAERKLLFKLDVRFPRVQDAS